MRLFCLCVLVLLLALPAKANCAQTLVLGVDAKMIGLVEHLAPFLFAERGIALQWHAVNGTGKKKNANQGQHPNCAFDALFVRDPAVGAQIDETYGPERREILYTEDGKNPPVRYSLSLARPEKCPKTRQDTAKNFSDWLAGPISQARIHDFRPQDGQSLFPNAKAPSR